MNILIICVNYNSNESLFEYLDSINASVNNNMGVDVSIVDNSIDNRLELPRPLSKINSLTIIKNKNNGYMGGLSRAYNTTDKSKYDYIILSNVDLTIDNKFFTLLSSLEISRDIGWIAPTIYSYDQNRDINPQVLYRPSSLKIKLLILMYKIPLLYNLYLSTFYKRKKLESVKPKEIYAGHGSFILLTREFAHKIPTLDYPIFLFGEEQYLAELCIANNLRVIYEPSLKVYDEEHVSTGKLKNKTYCNYNKEAQQYILKKYYE